MNFNKLGLVVLSASAIFMATSCNKGNTKVTEEEFKNALSFKGVEYLQIKQSGDMSMVMPPMPPVTEEETTMTTNIEIKKQMSPGVCYTVQTSTSTGDFPTPSNETETDYIETYATLEDGADTVQYKERDEKGGTFQGHSIKLSEEGREYIYTTPEEFNLFSSLGELEISFSELKYKNDAYTIEDKTVEVEVEGAPFTANMDLSLSFLNKKLSSMKISLDSSSEEMGSMSATFRATLGYKKLVPTDPSK